MAEAKSVAPVPEILPHHSIHADQDRIIQVLNNLTANAIKFSPADSRVTIRLEAPAKDTIRFSVTDERTGYPKRTDG